MKSLMCIFGALLVLVGCASSTTTATGHSPGTSGQSSGPLQTVTVALDWTPNTNHSGFYVAAELGYYAAAGIKLKPLPYSSAAPETLVSSHQADFAVSYQEGVTLARSAGADVVSVFAILQKSNTVIGVRADRSDIRTPADLDGLTYAGFGAPYEKPLLQRIIRSAGGKGQFKTVSLSTSAYEAVYAGKADFAMPEVTWEGIDARLRDKPLKTFTFADYGVPAAYSHLVASSRHFLDAQPDLARRFLAATQRGFAFAADHPDQTAALLIKANPSVLTNSALVAESARAEAAGYYRDDAGRIGYQTAQRWRAYDQFLFDAGILQDSGGKPLTAAPDSAADFTNDYLPKP